VHQALCGKGGQKMGQSEKVKESAVEDKEKIEKLSSDLRKTLVCPAQDTLKSLSKSSNGTKMLFAADALLIAKVD
jgi:hypothetical protein